VTVSKIKSLNVEFHFIIFFSKNLHSAVSFVHMHIVGKVNARILVHAWWEIESVCVFVCVCKYMKLFSTDIQINCLLWTMQISKIRSPVVNFINVKCANFMYKSLFSSNVLALNELSYKKCACKMLMKLTQGKTPKKCFKRFLRIFQFHFNKNVSLNSSFYDVYHHIHIF